MAQKMMDMVARLFDEGYRAQDTDKIRDNLEISQSLAMVISEMLADIEEV